MEVHFDNIKGVIIDELNKAKFSISVCVAWISENFIIEELCNCLKRGIQVELLLNHDDKFDYSKHKFKDYVSNGGRLFLFDTSEKLMHNKFCVIDLSTTITGSFNWTRGGTKHEENIIVERRNIDMAHLFAQQFVTLKRQSTLFSNMSTGNADLYHLVKVNYNIFENAKNDELTSLELEFREGSRYFKTSVRRNMFVEALGNNNYPREILGFWLLNQAAYSDEYFNEHLIEYYEFICMDRRFEGVLDSTILNKIN